MPEGKTFQECLVHAKQTLKTDKRKAKKRTANIEGKNKIENGVIKKDKIKKIS